MHSSFGTEQTILVSRRLRLDHDLGGDAPFSDAGIIPNRLSTARLRRAPIAIRTGAKATWPRTCSSPGAAVTSAETASARIPAFGQLGSRERGTGPWPHSRASGRATLASSDEPCVAKANAKCDAVRAIRPIARSVMRAALVGESLLLVLASHVIATIAVQLTSPRPELRRRAGAGAESRTVGGDDPSPAKTGTETAPPGRVRRVCPDGSWPVYQYLDTHLDQELGVVIDAVVDSMPDGLLRVYTPIRPDSVVMLRVAGLMACDGAQDDVALFLHALKWCVAKERSFRPASPTASEQLTVTSADATREWAEAGVDVDEVKLAKVQALLGAEWFYAALSGSAGEWTLGVPADVRRFRGVETIDDYVRIVANEGPPRPAANPLIDTASGPMVVVAGNDAVEVSHAPVAETVLGVDSLHPLVRDACASLFTNLHYREGVLKAALALRDLVREKSGLKESDDSTMMGKALGAKSPLIVVADLDTETGRSVQRGTVHLAQGILARLRNPLTHEDVELEPHEALEMVALISRVVRDVDAGHRAAAESHHVHDGGDVVDSSRPDASVDEGGQLAEPVDAP